MVRPSSTQSMSMMSQAQRSAHFAVCGSLPRMCLAWQLAGMTNCILNADQAGCELVSAAFAGATGDASRKERGCQGMGLKVLGRLAGKDVHTACTQMIAAASLERGQM